MMQDNFFSYKFSKDETYNLLSFFRQFESSMPKNLDFFYRMMEKSLYDSLTIEEIEAVMENKQTLLVKGEDFYG